MADDIIAHSTAEAAIHAPLAAIDLAEWVFTFTGSEYQDCSKHHIAAATTAAADGKRMSINVEQVGNLMVQHYVEDVAGRHYCRLVSLSDSVGPDISSQVKIVVIWSFAVETIDARTTRLTNSVEVRPARWRRGQSRFGLAMGLTLVILPAPPVLPKPSSLFPNLAAMSRLEPHMGFGVADILETILRSKSPSIDILPGNWSPR